MFGSKYILVLTLTIGMVYFPTTFGQWGEMTTTTTTMMPGMAIRVVEFSRGVYKLGKIFAKKSTYPMETIEF